MDKPFTHEKQAALDFYKVDPENGLADLQAAENAKLYGVNRFSRAKKKGVLRRVWEASVEPMMLMLIAAGVIALIVNGIRAATGGEMDFLEVVGIFAAIALSVAITVAMEGKSAKAFEALNKLSDDITVKVIRDGSPVLLPQHEIVAGDIVCVETGDRVPADGRLIESVSLESDESSLTGESAAVEKHADMVLEHDNTPVAERNNMLFSGCFITSGSGKYVVTAVGDRTEFGHIAGELSKTEKSTTPLQEKLGRLGKTVTLLGACAAALVFIIQLVIFISNGTASLDTVSEAFITSIILIVAAVPEGLPTIVAVSLSINIIKMSKQNALVKKMIACETVGCVNVICSDKTGTLTENKMTVVEVYDNGRFVALNKLKNEFLLTNFCLNSTADIAEEDGRTVFLGNPTECALLAAAKKAGAHYKDLRRTAEVQHVFSFSSETKNMTTVLKNGAGFSILTKGSPEKIIGLCGMDGAEREQAEREITRLQQKACRVIAFAHKDTREPPDLEDRGSIESGMVFDGFVAITDPLRPDVYDSVKECRRAGIDIKMLTGDNIVTAVAIADELNILGEGGIAAEARDLEPLSDAELSERLLKIRVIARSTPLIKMRVVKLLKAAGNVVAVTGDGINDAPAIKNADVGIAMGISGTEVSKEASDIVLLDDSFSTIAKSVKWGRCIYENFQRFMQFQLTVNLASVTVVLLSVVLAIFSDSFSAPFTALQLLWINLIMDGPPALTLGLEPIRGDLMDRQPTKRDAGIISKGMLFRIIVNGAFMTAVFLSQRAFNFMGAAAEQMPTVLFALFAFFQLFNAFNSRELDNTSIFKNLFKNKLMLAVLAATFVIQILITQFGGAFFGTVGLPLALWLKILGVSASVVLLSELVKVVKRIFAKKMPVLVDNQGVSTN